MVNFVVTYDKSPINSIIVTFTNAPKQISHYVATKIPPFLHKQITPLTTEPRQPTLPFIWSHDPAKQRALRAAYFRKLPKGSRGGRYVRSHRLVQAWRVDGQQTREGAVASVSNDVPYLDTVQGDEQYPSHRDSGWVQYDGVLVVAAEKAVDMVIGQWYDILTGDGP